jgi:hypothetical protein
MKPMLASMSRGIASVNMTGVRRIAALGQHLQPYPGINQLQHLSVNIENYQISPSSLLYV